MGTLQSGFSQEEGDLLGTASPTCLSSLLPHSGGTGTWPCLGEAATCPGQWPRREEPSGSAGGVSPPLSFLPVGEQVAWTALRANQPRGQLGAGLVAVLRATPIPSKAPLSPGSALKHGGSPIILKGESGSMKSEAKMPVNNHGRPGHEEPRPGTGR